MKGIALQLYSVRDALARDFEGTVRRVAAMGYGGVETAGFRGTTPEMAAALFRELGLTVAGMHVGIPAAPAWPEVARTAALLGCTRLVSSLGPEDRFGSEDHVRAQCDIINAAAAAARGYGLTYGVHNHWWEFGQAGGRLAFDIMREHMRPDVFFEPDVYWIQTAGANPADVILGLGPRAPLIHLKDGPCRRGTPMTALGEGRVDLAAVVGAAVPHADWLIVELDSCATDMLAAVERSCKHLETILGATPTR